MNIKEKIIEVLQNELDYGGHPAPDILILKDFLERPNVRVICDGNCEDCPAKRWLDECM